MVPAKTMITTGRAELLRPLLDGLWVPPIIRPALYGEMGFAWVDRIDEPSVCCLALSDFVFYAGDSRSDAAPFFVSTTAHPCLLLPSTPDWWTLAREKAGALGTQRRRTSFSSERLDRSALEAAAESLPPGFALRSFDERAVRACLLERWSRSFVENFDSLGAFLSSGLGYGVYEGDRLVSGASSFAVYDAALEIEVDTHPDYRRRGLATAAAARLAAECLDRGIHPHWDAANESSGALAAKLGFIRERSYEVLEL